MHEAFLNALLVAINTARQSGQTTAMELELEDEPSIIITVRRKDGSEEDEHATH